MMTTRCLRRKDTSQQFAVFFHKFGLVRLSFDPGVMTPGFSLLSLVIFPELNYTINPDFQVL
jgi:hypothetical protein